jgi:hypothetical protein
MFDDENQHDLTFMIIMILTGVLVGIWGIMTFFG